MKGIPTDARLLFAIVVRALEPVVQERRQQLQLPAKWNATNRVGSGTRSFQEPLNLGA